MKYDTLIFDMDGVVIDSEVLYDKADSEFFQRHGAVYNREQVVLMLAGMDLKQGTQVIKDTYRFDRNLDDLFAERRELLRQQYVENLKFIVGFPEFYAKVKAKGIKTCIGTASNPEILNVVEQRLKLSELFGEHIYKIADVGYKSKPDPAIYLYAAEKMNSEPSRCLVIEDAPKGIKAAKSAGMFCIGITTTFAADRLQESDLIIDSYEQVDLNQIFG